MSLRPIVIAAALAAGCAPEPRKEPAVLLVRYHAWNEEIRVDGAALTILHTQTKYTYDNPTSATPSGSEVMKLLDGKVTPQDVDELASFVDGCGFMALKDATGAPEGQRFYPYDMEVTLRGVRKKVAHRSNPQFEGPPEAFTRLEKRLKELSEAVRKR